MGIFFALIISYRRLPFRNSFARWGEVTIVTSGMCSRFSVSLRHAVRGMVTIVQYADKCNPAHEPAHSHSQGLDG